jgi:hypothetical protein
MKRFLSAGAPSLLLALRLGAAEPSAAPFQASGIYPHLARFNHQGECGTGAVVPWADRLWVVTYSPHQPKGSDDKLYEITSDLQRTTRPESIGGTPANRFIHRESNQLFIGPYAIDAQRNVRVIPYTTMYGRPTGNARHLTDPANKIYYASMEEGFYEVDVRTLAVTELFRDEQLKDGRKANLPGYHGKGLYSGQGRLIYANNGEHGKEALVNPEIPAAPSPPGTDAPRNGPSSAATSSPKSPAPATSPATPIPRATPCGPSAGTIVPSSSWCSITARGTRTACPNPATATTARTAGTREWPRIREIGEDRLLMTMHGAFWRFPRTFDATHSAGIAPRSNYLKVIADFARWNGRLVLGCDDTAQSEFVNKRRRRAASLRPGQSQSNLWFIAPEQLDRLGPVIGRGAVWLNDPVRADTPSDAYLFDGYDERALHLTHDAASPVTFTLEIDRLGNGQWSPLTRIVVPARGYHWTSFKSDERGAWIRVRADRDRAHATAFFTGRNRDSRPTNADERFDGLAGSNASALTVGLLHARGQDKQTLGVAALHRAANGTTTEAFYEMGPDMVLRRTEDTTALQWMKECRHSARRDRDRRRFRRLHGRARPTFPAAEGP